MSTPTVLAESHKAAHMEKAMESMSERVHEQHVRDTAAFYNSKAAPYILRDVHQVHVDETFFHNLHVNGFLDPQDGVAISFWIISIAMVASTVFFLMESMVIGAHWKTSMNVGALVTLIAAVHYFYMREFWVKLGTSPIVYRYIDWSLTVPLQMIEFYLILQAVKPDISNGMFWRLLVGTVVMLAFGYAGETLLINPMLGFIIGMSGWGFILYEVFAGEAGQAAANVKNVSQYTAMAFESMRFIVSVGWSIYPLGYFFGYMIGAVDTTALNLGYNLADFVNKIAFCLYIWRAGKADTMARGGNNMTRALI